MCFFAFSSKTTWFVCNIKHVHISNSEKVFSILNALIIYYTFSFIYDLNLLFCNFKAVYDVES